MSLYKACHFGSRYLVQGTLSRGTWVAIFLYRKQTATALYARDLERVFATLLRTQSLCAHHQGRAGEQGAPALHPERAAAPERREPEPPGAHRERAPCGPADHLPGLHVSWAPTAVLWAVETTSDAYVQHTNKAKPKPGSAAVHSAEPGRSTTSSPCSVTCTRTPRHRPPRQR